MNKSGRCIRKKLATALASHIVVEPPFSVHQQHAGKERKAISAAIQRNEWRTCRAGPCGAVRSDSVPFSAG